MEAREVYHKIRAIAEPYHIYDDQMVAIAQWVSSCFVYTPISENCNHSNRFHISALDKDLCLKCEKLIPIKK